MLKINLKKLLIIILFFTLTGCGFQLRGENFIPLPLRVLHFTSNNPYGDFETRLQKALRVNGIHLVPTAGEAPITLKILSTNQTYYPVTIGTSTQATVYLFTYFVTLAVMDSKGRVLVGPQTLTASSSLIVNANQVIGTNNQIPLLVQQLQMNIISQIFNLLGSEQVAQAVTKASKHFTVIQ